jgi:nitrite reductase/ring-hydroxylating ferredoxin subunit
MTNRSLGSKAGGHQYPEKDMLVDDYHLKADAQIDKAPQYFVSSKALAARIGIANGEQAIAQAAVDKYQALVQGVHQETGEELTGNTQKQRTDRKKGHEFQLAPSKDLSMLAAFAATELREKILALREQGVQAAMQELASHARCRITVKGQVRYEAVDVAMLRCNHGSTRATVKDGEITDPSQPHLHDHFVVLNLGLDKDGNMRSVDYGAMMEHSRAISEAYNNTLASTDH